MLIRKKLWLPSAFLYCFFFSGACILTQSLFAGDLSETAAPIEYEYISICEIRPSEETDGLFRRYALSLAADDKADDDTRSSARRMLDSPSSQDMVIAIVKHALSAEAEAEDNMDEWDIQCTSLDKVPLLIALENSNKAQSDSYRHRYQRSGIVFSVAKLDKTSGEIYFLNKMEDMDSGAVSAILGWRKGSKAMVVGGSMIVAMYFIVPVGLTALVNHLSVGMTLFLAGATGLLGAFVYKNDKYMPNVHRYLVWVLHGGVDGMDYILKLLDSGDACQSKNK